MSLLNDISSFIYMHLGDYLQQIGELTLRLIQSPQLQGIASQALEFWTSICYIEQQNPSDSLKIV